MVKRLSGIFFVLLFLVISLCSCSKKIGIVSNDNTSEIPLDTFYGQIIERIFVREKFDEFWIDNTVTYARPGLEYSVKCSDGGYIQAVTVLVLNIDNLFFDEITYHDIEKIDVGLDEKKKASIDAVRYSAMPLTLLCNLQDEDAIDAILDAREKDVIENGWKISCKTSDEGILITIEYTDK